MPGIPVDPHGVPLAYDAVTGRVMLSPELSAHAAAAGLRTR